MGVADRTPGRVRTVECLGETIYLRRPDRPELGPVIDAQLEQKQAMEYEAREALESGADEHLIAACIMVCVRDEDEPEAENPVLTLAQAFEWATEASVKEGTNLSGSALARTCMALCRASLTFESLVGKAVLKSQLAAASIGSENRTSR